MPAKVLFNKADLLEEGLGEPLVLMHGGVLQSGQQDYFMGHA